MKKIKFIDLCCGVGGFHQALKKFNSECVLASDIDKHCRYIYEKNYSVECNGDLRKIDISSIPKFDLLCAGFPCQTFSIAGDKKGFEDDRGLIFFDICKIIKHHKPEYVLLENVKNLKYHDEGRSWVVIRDNLKKLGYNIYGDPEPFILNSLDYGVPHNRERVIIMCKRKKFEKEFIKANKPLKNKLENFLERRCEKNTLDVKLLKAEKAWDLFLDLLYKNKISPPRFPLWTDYWCKSIDKKKTFYIQNQGIIDKNHNFYKDNSKLLESWLIFLRKNVESKHLRKFEWRVKKKSDNHKLENYLWIPRGSGIRVLDLDYCPTLTTMSGMVPIYGPEKRKITPKEYSNLQSFPSNFEIHPNDNTAYKQFGNSVNVKVIGEALDFLLGDKYKKT